MSFSPKTKEDALVSCQRRCIICHKFCGSKMECHHIRQARDGGDDSINNCVPMCFDCHADCKAYNPLHPKRCVYTESELQRHRDNWVGFCTNNPLKSNDIVNASIGAHSAKALMRGPRLKAKNLFIKFADFCIQYQALHPAKSPDRTYELTSGISSFKNSIEILGHLSIPNFVDIYSSAVANAWKLQRLLDRESGLDPKPIEPRYKTIKDNIDGIIDWFAQAKIDIKEVIDHFLTF